jgi:hypothetical protein
MNKSALISDDDIRALLDDDSDIDQDMLFEHMDHFARIGGEFGVTQEADRMYGLMFDMDVEFDSQLSNFFASIAGGGFRSAAIALAKITGKPVVLCELVLSVPDAGEYSGEWKSLDEAFADMSKCYENSIAGIA